MNTISNNRPINDFNFSIIEREYGCCWQYTADECVPDFIDSHHDVQQIVCRGQLYGLWPVEIYVDVDFFMQKGDDGKDRFPTL